jgi:hypothetical protein
MDIQLNIQEANHRTLINIDLNSAEHLQYVVTLLRSLNFVKKIEVISEDITTPEQPTKSRFNRFYGAAKTGLTSEQLEEKINEMRDEWERDI